MTDIIQLLPDAIANQIAAGEVVQRPASALKELLENSVDARATEIKLIINDAGKSLVQVIDNGSGMSEEIIDKIFIPFFSTRKTGSGIGLSLCKQIMLLHKGNIQVQSKEGEGSSFLLTF